MAFMSSPSSTNEVNTAYEVNTANIQVSPASTQVSTASTQVSTANLSDATVYAFLANQPNGSQLTGRKITINGSDTVGYDKSKVECFNCHKLGHFARDCRGSRKQDSKNWNQDSSKRTINVKDTSSKAMLAIDGAGFDWSYMVDDEVPINMALMAFLDSKFNRSEFNLATYKRGLAFVEEQLIFYKKNEVLFCEQIVVLKRDISYKDSKISELKSELEKLKQEKEINQFKIENFDNASKSLDKLIGSHIPDKSRKGLGFASYNVVPPPHTGLFAPPTLDLSNSGLEEFQQTEFEGYEPKISKSVSENISNEIRKSPDAPLVEELVSDDKLEKKTIFPTIAKIEFVRPKQQEKQVRKLVKYAKMYSFNHVQADCNYHQRERVVSGNNYTREHVISLKLKEFDRGYVTIWGGAKGGRITGKGTLKTGKLDFEDVYFVKELQFNLFSVLQMCDKKNSVLFTDTGCFVLSPDFKLADESQVLLNIPRKNNIYSVDMKNIVPKESLTCLVANATLDESMLCHRRLASKDETSGILKNFITQIENLVDKKVKIIRCDNGREFKNSVMNDFSAMKGIRREFSVARTPQQNGVTERRNRTLIEAAKTMLADSKLPTTFWAKAVNTACYVQNRVIARPLMNFLEFDGKSNDGFFVGYSLNSKAFRLYNIRTRKVEENLHVRFLEDKPIIVGARPKWLFDIDVLTESMNYVLVVVGTNSNDSAGTKESVDPSHSSQETGSSQDCILMPLWKDGSLFDSSLKDASNDDAQPQVRLRRRMRKWELMIKKKPEDMMLHDEEPKKVIQALKDPSWIKAMQEELLQFKLKQVWTLVDLPYGKRDIGTKWVFAPVARIEVISLFLAYASFKDFVVYPMDVKSAFLYGKIEEEVHVCQPPGFEDLEFLEKFYKVEKALYGLHQAPKAWYETLSTYLLNNGFKRGKIDKTLFIKRIKFDILLIQVYVDDIIFGSTEFEKLMHKKFQMSSMGELTFFLGLQVTQKDDGNFISQDKYTEEILKKFRFSTVKTTSTLEETSKPLLKDAEAEDVDVHLYRSMIRSLMYLTASRPDIMFAVCACARFQVTPKGSHLGLWYPKDSPFNLEAYADSDYAGASLDRKTTRGSGPRCQDTILGGAKAQIRFEAASKQSNDPPLLRVNTLGSREDNMILKELIELFFLDKQVEGMTRHKEVYVTPSHTKKVFANMKRPGKVFSGSVIPLFQTIMVQASEDMCEDSIKKSRRKQRKDSGPTEPVTDEATNEAHVPTPSYDPPQSSEDRMQLSKLMSICNSLQGKVLDLEEAKTAQAKEIASLKKREDASKQGRKIADIDADAEVTLEVVETEEPVISAAITTKSIPLSDADPVTTTNVEVTIASAPTTIDELTIAQTLIEIKTSKHKAVTTAATTTTTTRPKAKGIIFHDQEEQAPVSPQIVSSSQASQHPQAKDKGKEIMVEPERPLKKKDQVALVEEQKL
ncbi:retrovirus-related pol polyprotein from transposon TNT 1-94 [Tanacetum coccineum]